MFEPQVERRTAGEYFDVVSVVGKSIDQENCCSIGFLQEHWQFLKTISISISFSSSSHFYGL